MNSNNNWRSNGMVRWVMQIHWQKWKIAELPLLATFAVIMTNVNNILFIKFRIVIIIIVGQRISFRDAIDLNLQWKKLNLWVDRHRSVVRCDMPESTICKQNKTEERVQHLDRCMCFFVLKQIVGFFFCFSVVFFLIGR